MVNVGRGGLGGGCVGNGESERERESEGMKRLSNEKVRNRLNGERQRVMAEVYLPRD